MSQRNKLRKAAIYLLIQSCHAPAWSVKKIFGKDVQIESYPWVQLIDLKSKKYPIELLRDAADFLYDRKEIELLENQLNRFDIKIRCTSAGRKALDEHIHQDDISSYQNEMLNKAINWRVALIGVLIGISSFLYTVIKDNSKSNDIKNLQSRLEKLEHMLTPNPASNKTPNSTKTTP